MSWRYRLMKIPSGSARANKATSQAAIFVRSAGLGARNNDVNGGIVIRELYVYSADPRRLRDILRNRNNFMAK